MKPRVGGVLGIDVDDDFDAQVAGHSAVNIMVEANALVNAFALETALSGIAHDLGEIGVTGHRSIE